MNRRVLLILLVLMAFTLAGCFGGGGGIQAPTTYNLSGYVVDSDGEAIKDITLYIEGASIQKTMVTTGDDGKWLATGLKGQVTVTPLESDYTFEPENRTVANAANDVNFEGRLDPKLTI